MHVRGHRQQITLGKVRASPSFAVNFSPQWLLDPATQFDGWQEVFKQRGRRAFPQEDHWQPSTQISSLSNLNRQISVVFPAYQAKLFCVGTDFVFAWSDIAMAHLVLALKTGLRRNVYTCHNVNIASIVLSSLPVIRTCEANLNIRFQEDRDRS